MSKRSKDYFETPLPYPQATDLSAPIEEHVLNEVRLRITKRPNGSYSYAQDFQYCISKADQHSAHLTDINVLMERYKPDELAQYIAARNQHRTEIINHDFTAEPSLQEAKNQLYELTQAFNALPNEIRSQFSNTLDFLKFIDNPQNKAQLEKMGLIDPKAQTFELNKSTEISKSPAATRTTTQEEDTNAKAK